MPGKSIPYTVKSNPAMLVEVAAADGKKFNIELRLAILDVADLGKLNPATQMPTFEFKASLVAEVKPVTS